MDIPDLSDPYTNSVRPIPDINHIENTDSKPDDIDSAQKTKKSKIFVKPTLKEVRVYFVEREQPNAANQDECWLEYYKDSGRKIGRNSMKDWKAR